jgi:hypothetical protein
MNNKTLLLAWAIVIGLLFSIGFAQTPGTNKPGTTSSGNGSGIEGTITMSPAHPGPLRIGEESSKPLPGTKFVVQKEGEAAPAASFTTDESGKFHVNLPPGKYTVVREGGRSIGRYGPWEVEVTEGKMTSVTWNCDSGMR